MQTLDDLRRPLFFYSKEMAKHVSKNRAKSLVLGFEPVIFGALDHALSAELGSLWSTVGVEVRLLMF